VTNRGQLPVFVGLLPTPKATAGFLPYRSITEMLVALFLEWSPNIQQIQYEERTLEWRTDPKLSSAAPVRVC